MTFFFVWLDHSWENKDSVDNWVCVLNGEISSEIEREDFICIIEEKKHEKLQEEKLMSASRLQMKTSV